MSENPDAFEKLLNTPDPGLPVETARKHLGGIVRAAAVRNEITVISMHGIPAAAVVPLSMVDPAA